MKLIRLAIVCVLVVLSSMMRTFGAGPEVFVDLRDALGSWARSTDDIGSLRDMPDALIDGDLYEHAHALAESQIAKPALEALDMTHAYLNEFCGGKLQAKHTTTVFANMPYGQDLDMMMGSRDIIDDVKQYDFAESCIEVVKCYFEEELLEKGVDLENYDAYTETTFDACSDVMTRIYTNMLTFSNSEEYSRNVNYGDDMYANGSLEDSPYDLLVSIKDIGDLLFGKNQEPSKISFYDSDEWVFYDSENEDTPPDPDITEQDEFQNPEEQEIQDRLPLTIGVTPQVPDGTTDTYTPPTEPPAGWTAGGHTDGIAPSGGSIQNQECEEPPLDEEPVEELLESAEKERTYVYDRNNTFNVDDELAVALGSKMAPELEELFGDDDENVPSKEAQTIAEEIIDELADLGDEALDDFKTHVQSCVEQFTNEDKDAREKIAWKSITQPTAFTRCVLRGMCKEVGDESKLGLYRIKICKIPAKRGYNVNANQPVQSVEEIVDELSNVCFGLRESGQLLKHNKTKDHWTNKLMQIKLGDIFSFGVTVSFQGPPTSWKDRASIKREMIERNTFVTHFALGFNEDLTLEQEKNKYNILHDPIRTNIIREEITYEDAAMKEAAYKGAIKMSSERERFFIENQLQQYSELDALLQTFVRQNTDYWIFAAEHTKSMKETRYATSQEFNNGQ